MLFTKEELLNEARYWAGDGIATQLENAGLITGSECRALRQKLREDFPSLFAELFSEESGEEPSCRT